MGHYVVYILCLSVLDLFSSGFTASVKRKRCDCFGGCHSGDYDGHGPVGHETLPYFVVYSTTPNYGMSWK
jgi:hypothetical protein